MLHPAARALAFAVGGSAFGVLAWAAEQAAPEAVARQDAAILAAVVALLLLVGSVLQPVASAAEAALAAASFVGGLGMAAAVASSSEEGWGDSPWVAVYAMAWVLVAVLLALCGHAVGAVVRSRARTGQHD